MFFKWQSSIRIFNQVWKYSKYESIKKSSAPFHVVCNCRKNWRFKKKIIFMDDFLHKQGICDQILRFSKYFCKMVKLCPKNHYM